MLDGLNEQRDGYDAIRKLHLPNSVAPAFVFDPLPPGATVNTAARQGPSTAKRQRPSSRPSNLEDLAFASAMEPRRPHPPPQNLAPPISPRCTSRDSNATTPSSTSTSPSPKSALSPRPAKPTPTSRAATTAARSTACPGAPKTSSPSRAIPPPGARAASSIRPSTKTQPS